MEGGAAHGAAPGAASSAAGGEIPAELLAKAEDALGEAKAAEALEAARRLAGVFLGSGLGARALAAADRYVEWELALAYRGPDGAARVARGSVDLAFVEDGKVVVVDYKTDAVMDPARHGLQVAAYRRAAEEVLGLPSEGWLFYLYGGGRALRSGGAEAPSLELAPAPAGAEPPLFSPAEDDIEGSDGGPR